MGPTIIGRELRHFNPSMTLSPFRVFFGFVFLVIGQMAVAQTPAPTGKSDPDVLIFVDGERLIGHLEKSVGDSVTFKSDMAGEVTVEWSKVKEIHSAQKFAVVKKNTKLRWRQKMDIPQGTIAVADQKIAVGTAQAPAPETIPLSDVGEVIDEETFENAVLRRPGLFEDWKGSATLGISLVNGTQSSQSYTSAISLERTLPTETWMDPSSRTILNFNSAYGQLTQPATPLVKTSLYNGSAERDEYFRPRVYGFASASFDHDYSQGLDLQQTYGGGVGWTALKRSNGELDLKGELTFVNQQFFAAASNEKLLGSIFSESYSRTFRKKIVFREQISLNPAWTYLHAYTGNGNINLTVPVMKRMGVTVSTADQYLNDPSPGFKKNSYQFSTGLTYTIP